MTTKNIILFIFTFLIIILCILFINSNMNRIIPDYIGKVEYHEINLQQDSEIVSIRDKIASHNAGEEILDDENSHKTDDIVKQCISLLGNTTHLDIAEYHFEDTITFRFIVQNTNTYHANLLYTLDLKTIYFYNSYYDIYYTPDLRNEVISIEQKKEILEECKKKITQTGITVLKVFEPDTIWKLQDGIYSLKDTSHHISVHYSLKDSIIAAFSIEE